MKVGIALGLVVGAFVLSAVLTALARRFAFRVNLVAHPAADRYHRTVIPLGGGIAIYLTITAAVLGAIAFARLILAPGFAPSITQAYAIDPADFFRRFDELVIIVVCMSLLFAMGLWDDKKSLGPLPKLIVQIGVAVVAAALGDVRVELFIQSKVLTVALSAFWIVLLMNAFNFLDNMDGAAAGIAAIVSCILFTAAAFSGQILVGALALVFVGTLLGFLVFNFPPAKIFMGDAGSLVVGFFVALLSLRTTYYNQAQSGQWYPVLMPLVALAVPLYDFASVTLLPISQGKSPFIGDTQHFSHRLKRHGLTDTQTVLTLYLATLCTGLGAIVLCQVDLVGAILIFVQTVMVLAIIAIFESTAKANKTSGADV